jgi:hypothetical protein
MELAHNARWAHGRLLGSDLPGEDNGCQRERRAAAVCYLIASCGTVEENHSVVSGHRGRPGKSLLADFRASAHGRYAKKVGASVNLLRIVMVWYRASK